MRLGQGTADVAAGDDHGVDGRRLERARREDQAGGAFDRAAVGGDEAQVVAAGTEAFGDFEGRDGAGRVEQLEAREDDHGDGARHGRIRPIYVISDR